MMSVFLGYTFGKTYQGMSKGNSKIGNGDQVAWTTYS